MIYSSYTNNMYYVSRISPTLTVLYSALKSAVCRVACVTKIYIAVDQYYPIIDVIVPVTHSHIDS